MASFTRTKYEADNGDIYSIRLSPSRASQAGTAPSGAVTSGIKAQVSKGNREFGIRPRGVTLARTIAAGDDIFTRYSFLPVLSLTEYNSAAYALETELEVGDYTWTIVARKPEDF